MKCKSVSLARRYQAALRKHLRGGDKPVWSPARGLGSQALAAGLKTLDLAKLHEQTLVNGVLPKCPVGDRERLIKQAGAFFAVAITPIEKTHQSARNTAEHLSRFIETLSRRTVELAASNLELGLEITQRKAAEDALRKSERHYSELLDRSHRLQEQLRLLSRQILSAQEDERKRISRELHDVIAQTLTGINIRLATLKKEAAVNTHGLDRNIARTQKLVEKSVNIVHQFARELRPAVLDDLGLVPALHSFLKHFASRTGVQTQLTAFAGIEELATVGRTVLYRVAQEALNNVGRHAHAGKVSITLARHSRGLSMTIEDNGRGFDIERVLQANAGRRLGLLGMKERVEMIDGKFGIESSKGHGTIVTASIPSVRSRPRPARTASKSKSKSNRSSRAAK